MKTLAALVIALFSSAAFAQSACETKAVSADGKPLSGAAKASSIKKCEADLKAACEGKAVSAEGKKLAGAAKNAFVTKCVKDGGK